MLTDLHSSIPPVSSLKRYCLRYELTEPLEKKAAAGGAAAKGYRTAGGACGSGKRGVSITYHTAFAELQSNTHAHLDAATGRYVDTLAKAGNGALIRKIFDRSKYRQVAAELILSHCIGNGVGV